MLTLVYSPSKLYKKWGCRVATSGDSGLLSKNRLRRGIGSESEAVTLLICS